MIDKFSSQKTLLTCKNTQQSEFEHLKINIENLSNNLNERESELETLRNMLKDYKDNIDFLSDMLDIGIFSYNFETETVTCTAKFLQMVGFKNNNNYKYIFSESNFLKNVHREDIYTLMFALRAPFFDKNTSISCTIRIFDEDKGTYLYIKINGKYVFNNDRLHMIGVYFSDVTQVKSYESRIEKLAYHDTLTGLPNRMQFEEYIDLIIGKKLLVQAAFIYLDLDNFKYVNNTFGHPFGDKVIIEVSNRIINISSECMIARLGGDEIGIFYMNYKDLDEIIAYTTKLLKTINSVYFESGIRHKISASIGIALYPLDGSNFETLLKNADVAMYSSKSYGKNMYTFFTERMTREIRERFLLEEELLLALENKEFVLYYQPLLSLDSTRIVGFEALLRWYTSNEIVYPDKFIRSAEENGLIIPIGYHVLEEACKFIKTLEIRGYSHIHLAVNISAMQIMQSDFVSRLFTIIDLHNINAGNLELEITESLLIESFEPTIKKLWEIKERGIRISLDDFGTGYSSLTYLRELHINTLKIDKSFIDDIAISEINYKIVSEIINLAHILDIKTIAEGVETISQSSCLKEMGCDIIQGYLIGKPMPKIEIYKLLDTETDFIVLE